MRVEVKNLVRNFPKTVAVDDLSFSFESGNVFGFIGPNGAGKTTTIKIMAMADLPNSGDVLYDGISAVENPEQVRHAVGYMPDALPENSDIRVWEYLDFFARVYGLKGRKRVKVLEDIEEFTNLGGIREKYLKALSKGMKQRVCLARALVHNPQVLIMDEPANGLDPRARIELRELVKVLADQGKAILISSHILSELEDMCDGAVIIEKGKLLRAGTLTEINRSDTPEDKQTIVIRFLDDPEAFRRQVLQMPYVGEVRLSGSNELVVELSGGDDECVALMAGLYRDGGRIIGFRRQEIGLEELFMNITRGEVQ
ncbi:MAG: ABC transporter ATP-binding protein [Victivallales bacterium]|nr:ABC transporter ATP-binding protein [Victivallales bacterium]